jgi:DNA-binding LytR/AlgR family response regulator
MLAVITAYQYMRRAGRKPESSTPTTSEGRLLVQTGRGDALLHFDEIDYLEGARNYVTVHAGDREYVVRDTMANLLDKLATGPFVRTHRSYIVNIDRAREIRCVDSAFSVLLRSGREVPLSRGYRDAFKARFSA